MQVVVAPPTVFLLEVAKHLRADVSLAAQNVSEYGVGAFTGETAAAQVSKSGTRCVSCGKHNVSIEGLIAGEVLFSTDGKPPPGGGLIWAVAWLTIEPI